MDRTKRLPSSARRFIRKEKARIRSTATSVDAKEQIQKLVDEHYSRYQKK